MPIPTQYFAEMLGPAVKPFERINFSSHIQKGEAITEPFKDTVYDATENNLPPNAILAEKQEILNGEANHAKYLWVIDQNGLVIIPEQIPNPEAGRGVVCHTNLTGGNPAMQGGELWFDTEGVVYLNNKSGRYGINITLKQREAVLAYFRFVGYENVVQLMPAR